MTCIWTISSCLKNMKNYNFCTLFDSNFLPYGLTLYESLIEHCPEFHLYIFAFDDKSYDFLNEKKLSNTTIISLKEFEDEELLKVKPYRTKGEYCWTCASSAILYVLDKYKVDMCTYLDSDIFFFSDPSVLIEEMGDKSVLITEHRYSEKHNLEEQAGKYCVQFISFKNNSDGKKVLNWWRHKCVEWCFARLEAGKFGDQKYLDDWTVRFKGIVHELQHLGGGVAPWNIEQYKIFKKNDKFYLLDKKANESCPVVFFHYHNVKFNASRKIVIQFISLYYRITFSVYFSLYKEYFKKMATVIYNFRLTNFNFNKYSYLKIYLFILLCRLNSLFKRAVDKFKREILCKNGKTI